MEINNSNEVLLNIEKSLDEVFCSSYKLKEFWSSLNNELEIFIVGGFLREQVFNRDFRDIDIITTGTAIEIEYILEKNKLKYKKNRFNGYKINEFKISIDLWSLDDHLYYRNGYFQDKEDIENSCFLNIDSIIYNYTKKELYYEKFKQACDNKIIDFTVYDEDYINSNPNVELNILRILYLKVIYNCELSNKVKEYINDYCFNEKQYLDRIYSSQKQHYNCEVIKKHTLKELIAQD